MRNDWCRYSFLVLAAVVTITGGLHAMTAQAQTLATSSRKPIPLSAGPVNVTLAPPASGEAEPLSSRLGALRQGRRAYLVLKGLSTNEPPETLYQVYLGLPPGVEPKSEGLYYVGAFNFFNAVNPGGASDDSRSFSFDVTDLVNALQSRRSLGDTVNVTIVPAGKPNTRAKPLVGETALVAQ